MTDSFVGNVEISNRLGLHARAAAKLVDLANRFESRIEVSKNDKMADAKSIMGVLLLCGHRGATLTFHAQGADAQAAVEALKALVASGFGEAE